MAAGAVFKMAVRPLLFLLFLVSSRWLQAQPDTDSLIHQTFRYLDTWQTGYPELQKACATIGHRLTGSAQGKQAEEWIYRVLREKGISDVAFDPFEIQAWKRKSCSLEIVPYRSDNYLKIEAVSLANAASGSGSWHLVDGGDGLASDFKKLGSRIKGNFVLVNLGLTRTDSGRTNLHRAEKAALAFKAGAGGILFVHPKPGQILLTGTASLKGDELPIPAVCISGDDGVLLRHWMASEKLMAELKVENGRISGSARNVVARIPAGIPTRETILLCGHLDSWDLATGAMDNGIGSFSLLDIAAAVHQVQPFLRRNVVFLWTMGEEQGLLGSRHFVKQLKSSGKLGDIKVVLNLDMTGNPAGLNDFAWPGAQKWVEKWNKIYRKHVPSYPGLHVHKPDLHSDHQPFMLEGVPVFTAVSQMPDSVYRCYHANCDGIEWVNPADMRQNGYFFSALTLGLSQAGSLPFRDMPLPKRMKWLERHGLKEKLKISGEWEWKE